MNNEIKEILDYLDYGVNSLSISKPPFKIEYEDIKKLLDYISELEQQCKKQKEVIDKAIEYIEKKYYSKNTFDIDNIGMTTNELLQVRNILKRCQNE